jgi:hypothetical protein
MTSSAFISELKQTPKFVEVSNEYSQKSSIDGRNVEKLDKNTSKNSKCKNVLFKILSITLQLLAAPIFFTARLIAGAKDSFVAGFKAGAELGEKVGVKECFVAGFKAGAELGEKEINNLNNSSAWRQKVSKAQGSFLDTLDQTFGKHRL